MSETQRPRRIGRSIGSVVAGALSGIILSIGTDAVLRAAGIFPALGRPMSNVLFLFATPIALPTASREATSRRGSRLIGPWGMLWCLAV